MTIIAIVVDASSKTVGTIVMIVVVVIVLLRITSTMTILVVVVDAKTMMANEGLRGRLQTFATTTLGGR